MRKTIANEEMPRARTTFETAIASKARKSLDETNDCTVISLAVAAKLPYEIAHELLKERGRKHRRGSWPHHVTDAIKSVRGKVTKLDIEVLRKKNNNHGLTPNNIVKVLSKYRNYIAYTHNHALAIRKGKVEDWSTGRRLRITSVYEVKR